MSANPDHHSDENENMAPPAEVARGWRKLLLLLLAGVCLFLGAVGAILPGLPTTPFLLLTSYFLVRSSPQLNAALLRSKFFGPILTEWQQRGAVRADVKAQAVAVVVLAVAVSIFLSEAALWPTTGIVLLASIGVVVILRLPTANR